MSLIHTPPAQLTDAIRALCSIASPGGIVAIGFKRAPRNQVFLDPPDERAPVERRTTLLSASTVRDALRSGGAGRWLYSLQVPTIDPDASYVYAWTFHQVNP